jgi:hypothetical protein
MHTNIKTILIAKQRKLIAQHYKKAYKNIKTILIAKQRKLIAQHLTAPFKTLVKI